MNQVSAPELLDGLGIAVCGFDENDNTLFWNNSFTRIFPEHDGHVHVGEHYSDNLARFYRLRLPAEDLPKLDRYIADGIARHRAQSRPFVFLHHGQWLRVAAVPRHGGGRVRVWMPIPRPDGTEDGAPQALRPEDTTAAVHIPLEHFGDGITVLDTEGRIASANNEFLALYRLGGLRGVLGLTFGEVLHTLWDTLPGQPATRLPDAVHIAATDHAAFIGSPFELELPGSRWVRVVLHRGIDGVVYGIHSDITTLKRQQHELQLAEARARRNEERFRSTFVHSGIPTGVTLADGRFAEANAALCKMLDQSAPALCALALSDVLHPDDRPRVAVDFQRMRDGFAEAMQAEARFLRRDGSEVWALLSSTATRDVDGMMELAIHHVQDLTARRQAEAQRDRLLQDLRYQASHDALTGLANRQHFEQVLDGALQAADRNGLVYSLCFLDMDGFKQVNDAAGHAAGDALLRRIAALFREVLPDAVCLARLGGDEFGVLLRGCDAAAGVARCGELIGSLAAMPFDWQGRRFVVGLSGGVCDFRGSDAPMTELLRRADTACYAAKHGGRGQALAWTSPG